jgi:hypothetical protein
MTIKILQFQVIERYVSRTVATKFWQWIIGRQELDQYHFDVRIRIGELPKHLKLNEKDFVALPNGVRLIIWAIDRGNMIKAKTTMMTTEDLKGYKPNEMYLVYPRLYPKING